MIFINCFTLAYDIQKRNPPLLCFQAIADFYFWLEMIKQYWKSLSWENF